MPERRRKLRVRTGIAGHAHLGARAAVPCAVLNFSSIGACLAFPADTAVPRSFGLRIGHEPAAATVRVVWRGSDLVGVAFTEPRPVPDVLPG